MHLDIRKILSAIFFLLVVSTSGESIVAADDDNPFGLPKAYDRARPGKVVLHGGGPDGLGRGEWRERFREEFVKLTGGREARVLLMPSDVLDFELEAPERGKAASPRAVKEYEEQLAAPSEYGAWRDLQASGRIAKFDFLYRRDETAADEKRFYELLKNATGVWLPAYDQERLPRTFADDYPDVTSPFQTALRDVVARGGVVGGLGGGMASLSETIIAADADAKFGWVRAQTRFGLALFTGAIGDQNFDAHAGRLERLTDLLRNGPKLDRLRGAPGVDRRTIGLGVERSTLMILEGNEVRVMGPGGGHVFLKGNGDRTIVWRTLQDGESLTLRSSAKLPRAAGGAVIEPKNPFGMPEPLDPARPGIVVLHGGGDTSEIMELYPELAAVPPIVAADGTRMFRLPVFVHCPSASKSFWPSAVSGDAARLDERLRTYFSPWVDLTLDGDGVPKRFDKITFRTTDDPADANDPAFIAPLKEAHAMWFSGGDQELLKKLFVDPARPTLFQTEVAEIVRRGGVVGGTSAGTAIMPHAMIEGQQAEDGGKPTPILGRGLGVLKYVLAEQHFDARRGRIERFTLLLKEGTWPENFSPPAAREKLIGVAVEEDTALVLQGNRLRVVGDKLAHVFLATKKSRDQSAADGDRVITWHALKPGDVGVILQNDDGYFLELEDWRF